MTTVVFQGVSPYAGKRVCVKKHLKLRLSEMPLYIGPVVAPKPGSIDFVPVPQECDCEVTTTRVAGLFDVALCEKHESLAEARA